MSTTGWLVLAGIGLILGYATLILLIEVFGEWAVNREYERTSAATFEADYIPEAADVVEQERPLLEASIIAELDQVDMERQRVNREVAEWVAEP